MNGNKYKCKLCGYYFSNEEMSEEHYPAHSVGNDDIVAFNIAKIGNEEIKKEIKTRIVNGEQVTEIIDEILDTKLSKSLYPKGRTARTLCIKCNSFLGKYDEAFLKFFNTDGNADKIKGFQKNTKYQIIKSIYAKFLSIPETKNQNFDFIDFIKDEKSTEYNGKWNLYVIKRDFSTDLFGLQDIGTGTEKFDKGIVYELSDEKFIYNLMNFEKHSCFNMTNIFEILNKNFSVVEGVGEDGGYHGIITISRMFKSMHKSERKN